MASGPEHYKAAERLLARVEQRFSPETGLSSYPTGVELMLLKALVHATLAQAAATACPVDPGRVDSVGLAWLDAVKLTGDDEDEEEGEA